METKFQAKIVEIETAAQKRITDLETKLEVKTQPIEEITFDPTVQWYKNINYKVIR